MEQKAKRVGKFNIIDIIAVILIVAVVAFGAWKLLGSSGGTAAEDGGMVKVTYVVKCEGVPTELYETCQAHLPSPLMASGALVGGQIESVEMEPYYVLGPDGQWIEDPEHVTLLFTATTETPAGCCGEKGILFFVQFHAVRIPCCVRREDYVEERPQPACLGKWLCLKDIRASAGDLMVA